MAMIAAVPAVEAAAAPVAEAAAGRAAGSAASRAGGAAKKAGGAGKKAAGAGAGRTPKTPEAGPAGGPSPATPPETPPAGPPPGPQLADELLGTIPKGAKKAGKTATDAFKSATLKPPRSLNAKDASGFAFGLVLYALALSAIKYGAAGPKGWLSAKFLNKVTLTEPPK